MIDYHTNLIDFNRSKMDSKKCSMLKNGHNHLNLVKIY